MLDPLPHLPLIILSVMQIMLIVLRSYTQSLQNGILQQLARRLIPCLQLKQPLGSTQSLTNLFQCIFPFVSQITDICTKGLAVCSVPHEIPPVSSFYYTFRFHLVF